MIETLGEALKEYTHKTKPKKETEQQVLDGLERLMAMRPYDCEKNDWAKAASKLVNHYFRIQLSHRYKRLSPEILQLTTNLEIPEMTRKYSDEYRNIQLKMPVFACVIYGKSQWSWEGEADCERKENGKWVEDTLDMTLTADTPPLTPDVKQAAAEADACAYEIFAKALRTPQLREILHNSTYRNKLCSTMDVKLSNPTLAPLHILWRPDPEEIKVHLPPLPPDPDPALLLEFGKDLYLITTWNVEKELPFEHFLMEYAGVELDD